MSTIEMDLIRALIGCRSGVVLLPKRATTTVYQHQVAQRGGQLYLGNLPYRPAPRSAQRDCDFPAPVPVILPDAPTGFCLVRFVYSSPAALCHAHRPCHRHRNLSRSACKKQLKNEKTNKINTS